MTSHRPVIGIVAPIEPLISLSIDDTRVILRVIGDVDLSTIPHFTQTLFKAIDGHPTRHIILDLDEIGILDDVGLGIILGAAGRTRSNGGDLTVIAAASSLRQRLEITGFDRAVKCVGSLHEL